MAMPARSHDGSDDRAQTGLVFTALLIAIVLVISYAFVVPLADLVASDGGTTDLGTRDDAVLLDGTNFVSVSSVPDTGTDETVVDSRGFAVRFTGANDSYVTADAEFNISTGRNWTIAQSVWINQTAVTKRNMTVLALGDPSLVIRYHNRTGTARYSAYWIGAVDTHRINVTEPAPSSPSVIWVTRNGSNMTIRRNTTKGESVNLSNDGNFTGSLTASANLHGRLDETRGWNETLNASQRQSHLNNPVAPLPDTDRTMRIMWDAGSGTAIRIYFASTGATGSNISYAPGYGGSTLAASVDYEWQDDGPQIRALAGGALDGAPVAFATYNASSGSGGDGTGDQIIARVGDGIVLGGVVVLVVFGGVVLNIMRSLAR